MKLNTKFSLIALGAVFQFTTLAFVALYGSNIIQRMKNYQYLQADVRYSLADIDNFISTVDYRGVDTSTVYTDWKTKTKRLTDSMTQLNSDPVSRYFPGYFKYSVGDTITVWDSIKLRFSDLDSVLQRMQDTKIADSRVYQEVKWYGFKVALLKYPESEEVLYLNKQLELFDLQKVNIYNGANLLGKSTLKLSEDFIDVLDGAERIYVIFEIVFCILSAFIVYISLTAVTTGISRQIKKIQVMSAKLTGRDFTVSVKPSGSTEMFSLMENMNKMVTELNDFFIIVKKTASRAISSGYSINDSANSTAAATSQINTSIESITKEFEQINESVERSAKAIEEIDKEVDILVNDNNQQTQAIEDSDNAIENMSRTLGLISKEAEKRTKSAEEMRELVSDGDAKISSTNNLLSQIASQLDEIGEVVTIINAVAEQTNLLSMNAAIESAHAGEAGKGFSVVAEEIRSLAESTSDNAKKISESINKIVQNATTANQSSSAASEAFKKVSDHSELMINSLREISDGIGKIDEMTTRITSKTKDTAITADKINGYCKNLSVQQKNISTEMKSMTELFTEAVAGIKDISTGTEDIVKRMAAVGTQSTESYRNMTELENILDEFKTKDVVNDIIKQAVGEIKIENIVSPEIRAEIEAASSKSGTDIDFDPDAVEEYKPK
jgi:methyl-accepting chemotaxis protein